MALGALPPRYAGEVGRGQPVRWDSRAHAVSGPHHLGGGTAHTADRVSARTIRMDDDHAPVCRHHIAAACDGEPSMLVRSPQVPRAKRNVNAIDLAVEQPLQRAY